MTWAEIFKAIAVELTRPTVSKLIGTYLGAFLRQERGLRAYIDIYDIDAVTIKSQLSILGLLKVYVAQTTQGGTEEFMSLTDRGKQVKTEMLAVRKKPSSNS